jgi:hypothetical protein
MLVQNTGTNDADNVAPSALAQAGGGAATLLLSGSWPNPANATIAGGGSQAFTWVYTVAICNNITFSGTASGTDSVSGLGVASAPASSNLFTCSTATMTVTVTQTATETTTLTVTATPTFTETPTMGPPQPTSTATQIPVVTQTPSTSCVFAYPNPVKASGELYIHYCNSQQPAEIDAVIYAINGDKAAEITETSVFNNVISVQLNKKLAPGVYFYKLTVKYGDGTQDTHEFKELAVVN